MTVHLLAVLGLIGSVAALWAVLDDIRREAFPGFVLDDHQPMTTDTIRVWTRRELEQAVVQDPHERSMLRVAISPKMLMTLIEYREQAGERIEVLSAYGEPDRCELRFYGAG